MILIIGVQLSTGQHTFICSAIPTKVNVHIYLFGNTRPTVPNLGFATPTVVEYEIKSNQIFTV